VYSPQSCVYLAIQAQDIDSM